MKTYLANIIPSIKQFSQRLDDLTKLVNHHWVAFDDNKGQKKVYIFRENKQLLIAVNGVVDIGAWDYLGSQSLLIQTKEGNFLLKHEFVDESLIALKLDSTDRYAFFINENKFDSDLNTIENINYFLREKYMNRTLIPEKASPFVITRIDQKYDLIRGNYEIFHVTTSDKKMFQFFKKGNTGKFFFIDDSDFIDKMIYSDTIEDAISKYKNYLIKKLK